MGERVTGAAIESGIGSVWYSTPAPPQHFVPMWWQRVQPIAFTPIGLLVLSALTGALARQLRNYRGRLRALGIPDGWANTVVWRQAMIVTGIVLLVVVATSATTYALDYVTTVPEGREFRRFPLVTLGELLAGLIVGAVLGTVRGLRGLRVVERQLS